MGLPEWLGSLRRALRRRFGRDRDPDTRTVETTDLELSLYFRVDRVRFESADQSPSVQARAETSELTTELADDPHIREVRTDRYCPTPSLSPVFGDVVEMVFTTGTTITLGALANLLYDYLKQASGVRYIEIGSVRIPFSEEMDKEEFKQRLDDAWDQLDK